MPNRRHFLKGLLALPFLHSVKVHASRIDYLSNPDLKTLLPEFKGSPFQDGTFLNLDLSAGGGNFWKLLKWKFSPNPKAEAKAAETYQVPVVQNTELLNSKNDFICWLGHASFLIQLNGKRLLTDPCLTSPPLIERQTELPFPIEHIQPDYLLISHGHYDHLDSDTLIHFDQATALIPLKMTELINDINPNIQTQEAGWYQQYALKEPFQISFLPAHHWYRRTLSDKNTQLWGSFMITTGKHRLYFGGDSGYANHFKAIGQQFGEVDYAFLPIGAYEPRWMMQASHMNPQEALMAYDDLKAKHLIPMHFGTFDLTDEPMGEPEALLKASSTHQNLSLLKIGEPLWL